MQSCTIFAMCLFDTQLTASEVLRAFHRDEPYLFLGSAFTTVAIVAGSFCVLRRRFDALLICLALFAFLYGQRLWLDAELLQMTLPNNEFFARLRAAVNYLVPIPAFFFFQVAGFLGRRAKLVVTVFSLGFLCLVLATFQYGPLSQLHTINNVLVIIALLSIVLRSLQQGSRDREFGAIRVGLLCFVAGALWDNTLGTYWGSRRIEPYGFAIFLGTLGVIAARRVLRRDQELGELQTELEFARRIQLSILPGPFPDSANFRVAARYVPMTSVAGDYYDFLVADQSSAGLLIADVSGHGVPAALIASMVKMAATTQRSNSADPAKLLTSMNAALYGNTQNQFVTAAYVHLDSSSHQFRYSAAGHPAMLLLRRGIVTEIVQNGMMLGILMDADFSNATHTLEPGDRLLLYTDGILEARNARGILFGEEQVHAILRSTADLAPAETADKIIASIQQWAVVQEDDLTVLVCDYARSA